MMRLDDSLYQIKMYRFADQLVHPVFFRVLASDVCRQLGGVGENFWAIRAENIAPARVNCFDVLDNFVPLSHFFPADAATVDLAGRVGLDEVLQLAIVKLGQKGNACNETRLCR